MSEHIHTVLTRRERQIMDVLYRLGKATVGEVIRDLPGEPNYSTVRAQLGVLEDKGHVRHDEVGLRYVYSPIVPRHAVRQTALRHIVDTFFEGSTHKVVAALLGGEAANVSDEDLDRISELVRKAKKGETAMMFLLNCALKASLILAVALIFVRLLQRQSAALRHWVLAAGILCAAISPGLSLMMPAWEFKIPLPSAARKLSPPVGEVASDPERTSDSEFFPSHRFEPLEPTPATGENAPPLSESEAVPLPSPARSQAWTLSGETVVLLIWIAGFVLTFAILCFGTLRLAWIAFSARPLDLEGWNLAAREVAANYSLPLPPLLLQSRGPALLVTWGWRRPKILLPPGAERWPAELIRSVLCHELAHARRGDWAVQVTAELLRSVHWFNPVVWVACRWLRSESEQASDDAALNCGIAGSEYAEHLLDVVRSLKQSRESLSYALSMAHPSTLERRFAAILNPALDRRSPARLPIAATLTAFLILTVPLSMAQGSAAPSAPILNTIRSVAAAVTAVPPVLVEMQQAAAGNDAEPGVLQGIVRRSDLTAPLSEVQITLEGGPADAKSVQQLIQGVAARGVIFSPKRIGTVDEVVRDVTDQAAAQGVGPGFPIFDDAVAAFRISNAARFVAETGEDGRFTIKNVLPGQYTVHSELEGYFDLRALSGNPVTVTLGGRDNPPITVSMTPGGVISGHVRDASGEPQQSVGVQIFGLVYPNGFPTLRGTTQKLTDDHGAYRLFWLAPGEYYVAVNPGGAPNADATLRTLYPGTLDVGRAQAVTVHAGEQVSGIDIEIPTLTLPKISGKVISTIPAEETAQMASVLNSQLGRPTLMLLGRDPSKPDIGAGTARTIGTVTLNNGTGTFEVAGIPPGSYDLYARIPELNAGGGAGFAFAKVPLDVKSENITGISVTVNHSVVVTGSVSVDGKAPGATPIRIQLQPEGSGVKLGVYQSVGQRAISPNSEGTFSLVQVPPGLYRIHLGPGLPNDLYVADVRQGGASVFDSGVEITSEKPIPLQIALSSGAGTVEGMALDSAGKPLPGAYVVLVPSMARRQNRELYHTATADANGKFTIHNVGPGGYQLFAWQQNIPAGAFYNAGFLRPYEDRSRFVNVQAKSVASEQISAVPLQ